MIHTLQLWSLNLKNRQRTAKGQENAVPAEARQPKMETKETVNYANCAQILLSV